MEAEEKEKLLEQLRNVENQLSPEWLTCDGELPAYMVRQRAARLNKQKREIIKKLGYEPSFTELYPELAQYERK